MNGFLLYIIPGIINSLYLSWLIIYMDVFENNKARQRLGFPEEITLGDTMVFIGSFIFATVFWPVTVLIAIAITWDEFKFADVVLWNRKKKEQPKISEAELKATADKLGFKKSLNQLT